LCGVIGALIPRKTPIAVATPTPVAAKQTPVSLKTAKEQPTAAPLTKPKSKVARVININANLRNAPDEEASIIKAIPKDTVVKVIQQKGAWFLVDNDDSIGWMHGNTIKLSNSKEDQSKFNQAETSTNTPKFVETPSYSELPKTSSASSNGYIRGPRGGCYYINSRGNKAYAERGLCN
jgi:hypothetical protein